MAARLAPLGLVVVVLLALLAGPSPVLAQLNINVDGLPLCGQGEFEVPLGSGDSVFINQNAGQTPYAVRAAQAGSVDVVGLSELQGLMTFDPGVTHEFRAGELGGTVYACRVFVPTVTASPTPVGACVLLTVEVVTNSDPSVDWAGTGSVFGTPSSNDGSGWPASNKAINLLANEYFYARLVSGFAITRHKDTVQGFWYNNLLSQSEWHQRDPRYATKIEGDVGSVVEVCPGLIPPPTPTATATSAVTATATNTPTATATNTPTATATNTPTATATNTPTATATNTPTATPNAPPPGMPCPVVSHLNVPVAPATAAIPVVNGSVLSVSGASVWFNLGSASAEVRPGVYTVPWQTGTYTAYSLTVPASVWFCQESEVDQQTPTATSTGTPTATPAGAGLATLTPIVLDGTPAPTWSLSDGAPPLLATICSREPCYTFTEGSEMVGGTLDTIKELINPGYRSTCEFDFPEMAVDSDALFQVDQSALPTHLCWFFQETDAIRWLIWLALAFLFVWGGVQYFRALPARLGD